jgi:hypothetical protein
LRPETRPAVGRASWFEPIYPYYPWAYEVAVVLGRGKLAKIEVALSSRAEFQVKLLGSGFGRIAPVAASTSALLPSFSAFSEFEMKDRMLQRIE